MIQIMTGVTPGHLAYLAAREAGWRVERSQKMGGVVLVVTSDDRPGESATAFGHYLGWTGSDEEDAWEGLGDRVLAGEFWRRETAVTTREGYR